jgi:tetratricopeptide (TPR) repeat protein
MPRPSGGFSGALAELKRRSVFRVLAAYAVVAWIITQVTATVAPALHLPAWTLTLVVLLAILGFPIAGVLAWAYEVTPDGVRRTSPAGDSDTAVATGGSGAAPRLPPRRRQAAAWLVVLLLLASAGWFGLRQWSAIEPPPTGSARVAVLPFRVSGDASLEYLGEGMLDLLAAKLTGEVGPSAVEPRTLLTAWRRAGGSDSGGLATDAALALGASLGAPRILLGEVVSLPPRLVLSARLLEVRDGSVAYRASVEGPADSLAALVDRLAAQLLLVDAGESAHRLETLTSTSLPALTSYLQGQSLFRAGYLEEAMDRFLDALDRDSTFALAALAAWSVQSWGIQRPGTTDRVRDLAWQNRDRLSERDRLHLFAIAGPDYPGETTAARLLEAARRAIDAAPDRPELWFYYGDVLTHDGGRLGVADWRGHAIAAFERAAELGPPTSESIFHLVDLLIAVGDTARARQHGEAFLARGDAGEIGHYVLWLLQAVNDRASGGGSPEARLDGVPWRVHRWIIQNAQLLGGMEADAELSLARLRAATMPNAERMTTLRAEFGYLLNAGRPAEAMRTLDEIVRVAGPGMAPTADGLKVYAALYWDVPAETGHAAAVSIERRLRSGGDADPTLAGLCALEQWRIAQGELGGAEAAIRRLRAAAPMPTEGTTEASFCAVLLESLLAAARGGDVRAAADTLEAAFDEHLPFFSWQSLHATAPLVLAQLREAHGDLSAALAATRRRPGAGSTFAFFLSTYLREEARLAALAGEGDAAARALAHVLGLQSAPEPAYAAEVERIRSELAALIDARR